MIKAVIFDMDGLMFDTERLIMEHFKKASAYYNYNVKDSIMLSMIGISNHDSKKIIDMNFGKDFPYNDIVTKTHKYREEYLEINGVPKKKGLLEILNYCKSNNLKLAVATSTRRKAAEHLLKMAKIIHYFDTIVCGDEVKNGKPNPEIYLKASSNLGIAPEKCAVLEDSKYGILSASSANMLTIFIPDLVSECEVIRNNAAEKCASLDLAIPIIKKWAAIKN